MRNPETPPENREEANSSPKENPKSPENLKNLSEAELEKLFKNKENLEKMQLPKDQEKTEALREDREGIWSKCKNVVSGTFDTLVKKPTTWAWEKVKAHPIKTTLLATAIILGYMTTLPVPAGIDHFSTQAESLLGSSAEKMVSLPTSIFKTLKGMIASR